MSLRQNLHIGHKIFRGIWLFFPGDIQFIIVMPFLGIKNIYINMMYSCKKRNRGEFQIMKFVLRS